MLRKKTTVLLHDPFCGFEGSLSLETPALAGKPVVFFVKGKAREKRRRDKTVLPGMAIGDACFGEFDSLILPGASDIRAAMEDEHIMEFLRRLDSPDITIGAILSP